MMRIMSRHDRRQFLMLVFMAVSAVATPASAQWPFGRGNKDIKYRAYKDTANLFEIEYPEKDWKMIPLPVGGSLVVQFTHKDGPTFSVEHVKMPAALTAGERAAMQEAELERVRGQERATKDFKTDALETKSGRGVVIRYQQMGRGIERVVQCTLDVGVDLFRLNGVMPERLLAQFEPIFAHMIESFKSPASPAVTPPAK